MQASLSGKTELRKQMREIISHIEDIDFKNDIIFNRLIKDENIAKAKNILLYASFLNEVDTKLVTKYLLNQKKNVFFPKCSTTSNDMEFYKIEDISNLSIGAYGILEPSESCDIYIKSKAQDSVCVVPALAFTKDGTRLGRGKGYYDKFLENFNGVKIGICFNEQIKIVIPTDNFDVRVDYIISS